MKTASYLTTGAALPMVALFGLAYATDSHLPGISPMAAVSIFIDGTKDILPTNDSQASDRMRGALHGDLDQCAPSTQCANNVFIDYPREFGIMTGLGSHTYEDSKADAAAKIKAAIETAEAQNPDDPIYVVGFSQGSNAASDVLAELEAKNPGVDYSNVNFVLLGNGARNDGGLWARMPAGVYVPLIGLRFGASTNPAKPSYEANAPQVIQISKQYDGASDVPKYVMNPIAWANVAMGFMSVHNGYYNEVDMDLTGPNGVPDGKFDQLDVEEAKLRNDDYIVTTNGNITDIVIKNKVGDLPLTQPLLALGVPREVVEALDPLLRAIIETGYDRAPDGGTYAAKPVHLELMPGLHQTLDDFHAIAAGMRATEEKLAALNTANLMQNNVPQPLSAPQAKTAVVTEIKPAPTGTPAPPNKWAPRTWAPQPAAAAAPVTQAPVPSATVQPTTAPVAPAAQQAPASTGEEVIIPGTSAPKPQVSINKSLQQINKAITGTVKSVVGALTPKPRTGGTTTSEPEPPASTDPGPSDPGPASNDNDTGNDTGSNDSAPAA